MPFQIFSGKVFDSKSLVKSTGVKIDSLFYNHKPFSDYLGSNTKTDSKAGGKTLGKSANIYNIIRHKGFNWLDILSSISQSTIWIVFNKKNLIFLDNSGDFFSSLKSNRSSSRVLEW